MLWVAPGWRPPPYPQALACALAAHAAHARARPRTPRTRAHARARARTRHYARARARTCAHAPRTPAHARARPRTPAHVRARPRTPHYAALPRFPHAQIPSRSDSLSLRFRARGCAAEVCRRPGWSEILRGRAWAIAREGAEGGQVPEGIWVMWVSIAPIRRSIRYRLVVRRWRSRRPPHCFTHNLSQRMCLWMCVCDVCARVCVCARMRMWCRSRASCGRRRCALTPL